MPVQKAEARFDFRPTADVELELRKGDVVVVRRMSVGEGWWEGELNGKRGLFPSSFVTLLPIKESVISTPTKNPLTPRTSKKAFMETLLTPAHSTQEEIYDREKAMELFVPGHTDIGITIGPRWDCSPPVLTIIVKDPQTESKFSGIRQYTVYEVETKELNVCVSRRYKQFLWLYDRLAECFPCISLPPMPVKQFSGSTETDGMELRRRGLEKFLHRIAIHPLLGSTKLFRDFLTIKDDKEWKIGRHASHGNKFSKASRKLFQAPIYTTVNYPPYNVPLNQLASIEKFERFSRLMELNVNTVQQSYTHLNMAHGEVMSSVNLLGRDLQRFVKGMPPTTLVQRRKFSAATVHSPGLVNGQSAFYMATPQRSAAELEEDSSEDEGECISWNWREDSKFNAMMRDLHDIGSGMRRTGKVYQEHKESMERKVLDTLKEYSGIIHTLPILVRLHEDAMETYNTSKEKDSRKEAEEVRQNCETLNNILLAEFDYFSSVMVDDFQDMMGRFLQQQADFHRQMAEEWDQLHARYMERTSRHKLQPDPRQTSPYLKTKSTHSTTSSEGSSVHTHGRDQEYIDTPVKNSDEGDRSNVYVNFDMVAKRQVDCAEVVAAESDEEVQEGEKESSAEVEKSRDYEIPSPLPPSGRSRSLEVKPTEEDDEHHYQNWQFTQLEENTLAEKKAATHQIANMPKKPQPPPKAVKLNLPKPSLPKPKILDRKPVIDHTPLEYSQITVASPKTRPASVNVPMASQLAAEQLTSHSHPPAKTLFGANGVTGGGDISSHHLHHHLPETKPRSHTTAGQEKKQPLLPPIMLSHGGPKHSPLKSPKSVKPPETIPEVREHSDSIPSPEEQESSLDIPIEPPKIEKSLPTTAGTKSSATVNNISTSTTRKVSLKSTSPGASPSELMRKLSVRRQKIEQQLSVNNDSAKSSLSGASAVSNAMECLTERSDSVSSTQSNTNTLVLSYSTARRPEGGPTDNGDAVVMRKTEKNDGNLVKFGIIEDFEGGSYVI